MEQRDETILAIDASYNAGDSLPTLLAKVGTDDETLRLISATIGVAMSTLRRTKRDWFLET